MHEFISRPATHFLEQQRKLILRRQKKNRMAHVHGAFTPEHVYAKQQDVEAISPLEAPRNLRVLDTASDVAQFVNGLRLLGAGEDGAVFAQRYATAAKDRDLEAILPIYQVYQAVRAGLLCCEWAVELSETDEQRADISLRAMKWFELAVEVARALPK
jgi:aminoglycoside phosphotransferase family enzyme